MGIKFAPFSRRENRRSLAISFAEEIAHLGALKIARFCGGAVPIAAATAENRAILVHSAAQQQHKVHVKSNAGVPVLRKFGCCLVHLPVVETFVCFCLV